MADRKYSVSEIDRMRIAITWSYPCGAPYSAKERSAEVENRLRTHMQNGTDPEELVKSFGSFARSQSSFDHRSEIIGEPFPALLRFLAERKEPEHD